MRSGDMTLPRKRALRCKNQGFWPCPVGSDVGGGSRQVASVNYVTETQIVQNPTFDDSGLWLLNLGRRCIHMRRQP